MRGGLARSLGKKPTWANANPSARNAPHPARNPRNFEASVQKRPSLLHARKKSGLTQEEVAEKLGVSRQTISKWETGKQKAAT